MSDPAGPARSRALDQFAARFGGTAETLIRSPGRVNLIGDHTDYSDGFVLPVAIDRGIWLAIRARNDTVVRVWSEHGDVWAEFDLDRLERRPGWQAYIEGVAHMLGEAGWTLRGFDGTLTSDLPTGAGLSSSAALELAAARAFAEVGETAWDPTAAAVLAQRAENQWVGMKCGIMDQLVCATGKAGHAVLIDCRSLEVTPVAIPDSAAVVVLDTMTRRKLVDSAYNERRAACETAAAALGVPALRDVDHGTLERGRGRIDDVVFRRARHVVNENAATLSAAKALAGGDVAAAGMLMNASHSSLRDDFEVSTDQLDAMAAAARSSHGCYGARMTGAGFGGSVVALVAASAAQQFQHEALTAYESATGIEGRAIVVAPSDGTSVESRSRPG
jgi:galactokinase